MRDLLFRRAPSEGHPGLGTVNRVSTPWDLGVGAAETGESVARGRTREREGWDSQRG
jgi:hypothetical protein